MKDKKEIKSVIMDFAKFYNNDRQHDPVSYIYETTIDRYVKTSQSPPLQESEQTYPEEFVKELTSFHSLYFFRCGVGWRILPYVENNQDFHEYSISECFTYWKENLRGKGKYAT